MSDAFTEILRAAERAAAGSEADKRALAQLLNGIDLVGVGGPEDRTYLAVLLDWLGMRQYAMLALRPGDDDADDRSARMPNVAGTLASGHGEYDQARDLFVQALSEVTDSTLQAKIVANLAALSLLTGEVGSASAWLAREELEQAYDPATGVLLASAEYGIARAQGDLTGMRASISRLNVATRARIAELGSDHPLALTAAASLASAEFELASAEESVEGQERSIAVLEVAAHRLAADLGADHPQALTCLENMCVADFRLARASRSPDRASQAASMLETVSRRTTAALGQEHPQARAAAANAAAAQLDLRRVRTSEVKATLGFAGPTLSRIPQQEVRASAASLPPDIRSFTGRAAELEWLRSPKAGSVTIVHGMPGVGKTALSVHAAHEIRDQFPGGQLFLNLCGHVSGRLPLTPSEALRSLLLQLAVPSESIPDEQAQREALYRAVLQGRRALILLDDASTAEQVRPLLPRTVSCRTIITSRTNLLNVDESGVLALGVLPKQDAVALFRSAAYPNKARVGEEDIREIVTLCGQLPLALRIAAARLGSAGAQPLDDLLSGLRDPGTRLGRLASHGSSVVEVFGTSLKSLPSAEQQFFGRLSIIPGQDFDAYAAASLSGTAFGLAQEWLESLLDHSLLMQVRPGRYQFHDLVRRYASTLSVPGADQATENLLNYYLSTAALANRLIDLDLQFASGISDMHVHEPSAVPPLRNSSQAAEWLDAELANLDAVAQLALKIGRPNVAISLAAALSDHLILRGSPPDTALSLLSIGLQAAIGIDDLPGQVVALLSLGRMLADAGEYSQATDMLAQALTLGQQLGDQRFIARVLVEVGRTKLVVLDIHQSQRAFSEALSIYRQIGDRRAEASCLLYLGRLLLYIGDFSSAEQSLQAARALGAELARPDLVANCQLTLGRVHLATGRISRAEVNLRDALSIYTQLGHYRGMGLTYASMGSIATLSGRYNEAQQLLRQALAVFSQLGDTGGIIAELHNDLARLALATGQVQEAHELYTRALRHAEQLVSTGTKADSFHGLAITCQAQGRTSDAVEWYRRALELYEQLPAHSDAARVREALSMLADKPSDT